MSKETSKLASVFKQLKKDFDVEPVDLNKIQDIPRWKVSYPSLSYLLWGGLPKGRIIEIYGQESGGKSLMSTLLASDVQKQGGTVVYIDMERSFSVKFAEQLGLNCSDNFILIQPNTGEDVFNIIRKVAETGEVALIIVDSVSAMVPKAELEGDVGDAFMGLQARMMGQGLRMITGTLNKTGTTTIFINQLRQKIGVMYGNPNTTSGGNSLKFYASIRMDVSRKENIGPAEKVTGIVSKIKTPKNKTAPPFRVQEITIDFKKGVDLYMEYVNFGIMYTFITRAGAWYTYEDIKAQGREGLVEELKKNDVLFNKLKISVDNQLLCDTSSDEAVIDEEDETVVGDE